MTSHCVSGRSSFLAASLITFATLAAQAQQSNNGKTSVSSNGQSQAAEVRTEKFKVKQEFGPQTVARHSDRTNTATPPGQSNGNSGSTSQPSKFKQEFGPQTASRRDDNVIVPAPQGQSASNSGTKPASNGATDHQEFGPSLPRPRQQNTNVATPRASAGAGSTQTAQPTPTRDSKPQ